MITERTNARGEKVIVVLLTKRAKDGTTKRYRQDATIQTAKAAKLEEEALLKYWYEFGTFKPAKPEPVQSGPGVVVPTWEDALKYYREHGLQELKESARRQFEWLYTGPRFEYWKGWELTKITTAAIGEWQRWIVSEGLKKKGKTGPVSESLVNACRSALLAALRDVGPDEDEQPGPMLSVLPTLPKMPKGTKKARKMRAPSPATVEKLMNAAHPNVRFAFEVAAMLGTRAGEVRALIKSQFDLEAGVVCIDRSMSYGVIDTPKGGEEAYIPIDPRLMPPLKARLDSIGPDDYVCVDEHGQPWSETGLGHRVEKLKKKLGLSFDQRFHALRHFFGSETVRTTDLKTTSKLMRHSMVSTTERYLDTDLDRMRAAIVAKAAAATLRATDTATAAE